MSAKRKIVYENNHTQTNEVTGEVTMRENKTVFQLPKEPPYIKVYLQDISKLYGMSPTATGLLYELAMRMSYDGTVCIVSHVVQTICEKLNIKQQSYRNTLDKLIKQGLVLRINRGYFELNPDLFGKGDWCDISKRRLDFHKKIKDKKLQVIISYDCETGERTINTNLRPK